MARSNERFCLAFVLILLMVFSVMSHIMQPTAVEDDVKEIETTDFTSGRQVDADCTGYSFEDMFYYNYATFHVEINQNWDGAFVRAMAMVNGTDAANMRDDLDGLFEGLPGGDNGWLSTDEKDGVEAVGKDCVEQTYTRIGFRGGSPHRGGAGVNWNNATWIKEGMTLEETNLIPEDHPERRSCKDQFGAPSGSPTCEEIPNYPANAGQCGPHSCDTIVFLNSTVSFDSQIDSSNFTLAMVGRNLTKAQFTYIFPSQSSPLRVANSFEEHNCNTTYYEDDEEADDYQTTYSARNECVSYQSTDDLDYSLTAVNNGISFSRLFTYDERDWPAAREYFIDFTTSPPPVDNPPTWTNNAPAEGELLPVAGLGESEYIVELNDINAWFDDDLGSGMLNVDCTGATGWNLEEAESNHWMVTSPSEGATETVICEAWDSSGQSTGAREFQVGPIFSLSAANTAVLDEFVLTFSPVDSVERTVTVTLMQYGVDVDATLTLTGSDVSTTISAGTFSPGTVEVHVVASASGMAPFSYMYDLGLSKQSLPPSIQVDGGEWVGTEYTLIGHFSDPDGETVSFTQKLDGVQQGVVSVFGGNQWETQKIDFELYDEGVYTISIEACDTSGMCTTIDQEVDNTFLFQDSNTQTPTITSTEDEEGGGLPGPGILLTTMALIGAGLVSRRRE